MNKTYILRKQIDSPSGSVAAGTESIFDGGFYCFGYTGRAYNQDNNGWLGNSFMTSDPEKWPEWFILKEENKSNDSFQWTDDDIIYAWQTGNTHGEHGGTVEAFINYMKNVYYKSHTPKPQAENKPDRDWEILEYLFVPLSGMARYATVNRDSKYWERAASGDKEFTIHSVKRLSDGEVFSVGDVVVHKTDGLINTAKILKFVIPETLTHLMWFEFMEGRDFCKDLANFNRLPPQPQKEEQRIEINVFEEADMSRKVYAHNFQVPIKYRDKFPEIKQAIEQVLNDDTISEKFKKSWEAFTVKYPEIKDKQIRDAIELLVNNEYVVEKTDVAKHSVQWFHPYFTQQEVDAMCEDFWYAARAKSRANALKLEVYKYEDIEDYKKSKQ